MSPSHNPKDTIPSNPGPVVVIANADTKAPWKRFSRPQAERGDDMLNQARDFVTGEARSMIEENDVRVIEDRITLAREMKIVLNTKSGIKKTLQTRRYNHCAERVYQDAKLISDRAHDRLQFHPQPVTSLKADDNHQATHWHAQSLYRCKLICKNAFPSSLIQGDWVEEARKEAYFRTEVHPNSNLLRENEIKCDSMRLITDIKTMIKHAVDSSYEFDTSRAPDSIGRNASRAQALLDKAAFIYRNLNSGERPRYPYRRPIIQSTINITWFQDKDDIGIVFHEYFNPIPFEAIALVVTVIECRIDEWSTGTCKESNWKVADYETNYFSHLNSLRDLEAHGSHQEGKNMMRQIQDELLRAARTHAGATPDPTTGAGKLSLDALDEAVEDDHPRHDSDQATTSSCR